MNTGGLQVAGDIGAGHAEIAGSCCEIGSSAWALEVEADLGILGAGHAAVVRGETQGNVAVGDQLEDLGDLEFLWPVHRAIAGVLERRHLRCTAFEYKSSNRDSGSYFFFSSLYFSPP